ncbi:MAG TPA: DUF4394 domain-containing protein [Pyrinomonadaceae bacterium]
MRSPVSFCRALAFACAAILAAASAAQAQTGYGVNSAGTLFRFDVNNAGAVAVVGTLPFTPEGIDFRPGTSTLYALDVGAATTQLYTINILTGDATPVGGGFPSAVSGQPSGNYSLLGATIGFDFNPRTLQADGSVRIRVVASNGTNLRLNSDTGQIAAIDTPLDYPDADPNAAATPMVDAAAYINSARSTAAGAGTTTLYVMDFGTDDLSTQNPPNAGQLNTVGPFGASVNADSGIGFDIVSDPASTDDGIGGDRAYAVLRRPDAPAGNEGAYLLYDVNLSTGQITGGRFVGGGEANFGGGFAVLGDLVSAGGLVISEFRFRGPNPSATPGGGLQNEFIELYNASGSDIVVSAADGSEGFSVAASVPSAEVAASASARLFVIPNGTVIPARGHYLAVNGNGFSLINYPAGEGGVSFGDNTYSFDIGDAEGVALFNTANTANYSTTTRLDAAGFATPAAPPAAKPSGAKPRASDPLFVEGAGIPRPVTVENEHSFVRRLEAGPPQDTNDNAADFVLVSTDPFQFEGNPAAVLGAPGPESSQSPIQRNELIKASLIDPNCTYTLEPTLACGTTRDETPDAGNNSTFGTLRIRRRWTNNTQQPVSRMRFRIVDITTFGSPNVCNGCEQADLRARTSGDESGLVLSAGGTAGTQGLTLEVPAQPDGGGLNSTLSVALETPIPPGGSVNVNFLLGVQDTGLYRFYVNVEVLNSEAPAGETPPSSRGGRKIKSAVRKGKGFTR